MFLDNQGDEYVLLCPVCRHEYTHHQQTIEYQRDQGEDGPTTAVTVMPSGCEVVSPVDDNPSPRRDAVVLSFEGECGHQFDLTFVQHKGWTFVRTMIDEDDAA